MDPEQARDAAEFLRQLADLAQREADAAPKRSDGRFCRGQAAAFRLAADYIESLIGDEP